MIDIDHRIAKIEAVYNEVPNIVTLTGIPSAFDPVSESELDPESEPQESQTPLRTFLVYGVALGILALAVLLILTLIHV